MRVHFGLISLNAALLRLFSSDDNDDAANLLITNLVYSVLSHSHSLYAIKHISFAINDLLGKLTEIGN